MTHLRQKAMFHSVDPSDSEAPAQILKNADLAMYAAKSSGQPTYRLYSVDPDQDAKRRRLVATASVFPATTLL